MRYGPLVSCLIVGLGFFTPLFNSSNASAALVQLPLMQPLNQKQKDDADELPPTWQEQSEAVIEKRNELTKKRDTLETQRNAIKTSDEKKAAQLDLQINLLKNIDLILGQQVDLLSGLKKNLTSRDRSQSELDQFKEKGLEKAPPYSFSFLDQLEQDFATAQDRKLRLKEEVANLNTSIEDMEEDFQRKERGRRQILEKLTSNKEAGQQAQVKADLAEAELASELVAATIKLLKIKLQIKSDEFWITDRKLELLTLKIEQARPHTEFSDSELKNLTQSLRTDEMKLRKLLEATRDKLQKTESELVSLQNKLITNPGLQEKLAQELEARQQEKDTLQLKNQIFSRVLSDLNNQITMWEWRQRIFNDEASRTNLRDWRTDVSKALKTSAADQLSVLKYISEHRKKLLSIEEVLETSDTIEAPQKRWLRYEMEVLKDFIDSANEQLLPIDEAILFYEKILAQIDRILDPITISSITEEGQRLYEQFWHYEVGVIDDRPLTVQKIVIAFTLFLLGILFSKHISRILGKRLYARFGHNVGAHAALQSITQYILLLLITIFALKVANVPLTLFTLLGGAIAIGIGFGSQNLINNFISGLILLMERPINVSDMIELEGMHGRVIRIGARCTHIRTFNNIDILVPNSSFLEKNVINWTHTDDRYRTMISVGVSYGSDTQKTTEMIKQAVTENERVLKFPEPIILFSEFGDNALIFEVHFWIRMRILMDRKIVESEIRYRIDELFREAGITIAFPQRDVHLDTLKPLNVQMVSPSANK